MKQRIFGIDILRILAIGMVVLAQWIWMLHGINPLVVQAASVMQFIGLEVFFVLSGFLMCKKLYPMYLLENFGWQSVREFVKRRLMQILPLYFMALALNSILSITLNNPNGFNWKYFVLLQNFSQPMPAFFHESWGLTIVLFGSILFPIVLWVFDALFKPRNKRAFFLCITLLLIALFVFSKAVYNHTSINADMDVWDSALKSVVIYRLDSVFIGLFTGWLLLNWPQFFSKMKVLIVLAGIFGIAFLLTGVGLFRLRIENHPAFWNIVYLPLTSIIICCFVPILHEWKSVPSILNNTAAFGSKLTYAFYMLNCSLLLQSMHDCFLRHHTSNGMASIIYMIYLLMVLFLSVAVYKYYQRRFLR